jgi:ferrous-iron efflux pump FieF
MKKEEILNLSASFLAMSIALVLVLVKFTAWDITDSVSILSSLVDSILDVLISFITFLSIRASMVPADQDHRFGHGKYQAIAALAQAIIIISSVIFVVYQAAIQMLSQSVVLEPSLGIQYMATSLLLTSFLVVYQRYVAHKTKSIAIKADSIHYLSDIFTNIAVIVSLLFSSYLDSNRFDIIVGIFLMIIVLYSVKNILFESLNILSDRELDDELREKIKIIVLSHASCLGVHDLRTRDGGSNKFIQFHMEMDPEMTLEQVHRVDDEITEALGLLIPECEVIIHMDPKR